jgi:hypothetical protein
MAERDAWAIAYTACSRCGQEHERESDRSDADNRFDHLGLLVAEGTGRA